MKHLSYLFIILFFAACQAVPENTEEITPLVHTKASELFHAQTDNITLNDIGILNPSKMVHKDSLFILLTPHSSHCFAIYNQADGKVCRLVPAGKGDSKGLFFLNLHLNGNTVSSFDFGQGRLVEIDLTRCTRLGYQPTFTDLTGNGKKPLGAIRNGNTIISTGIYPDGRYCVTASTGNHDTYSVPYPQCAASGLNDTLKSIFYASNSLALHPAGNRLACANLQYGCLDLCNIEGERLSRLQEIHLNRPGVLFRKRPTVKGLWHPVAYTRNNLFGFCDLSVSDSCIYALYSGRSIRNHSGNVDKGRIIFAFDWNGTHLRTYHLSVDCSSISYDASTNSLYALSHHEEKSEIITLTL